MPVGFLCAIGFTVSLLISELSFTDQTHLVAAKVGILTASVAAAVLGAATLRWDVHQARGGDMNRDGVADLGGGAKVQRNIFLGATQMQCAIFVLCTNGELVSACQAC